MEPNTQRPMNSMPNSPMAGGMNPSGTKKVGPIVSTLVIVLILIIAALYLFASKVNKEPVPSDTNATASGQSAQSQTVPTITSKSDDPASMQADLNASTQNLDQANF